MKSVSENHATDSGGGLYNVGDISNDGAATLNAITVTGNIANSDANGTGDGGGIANINYGVAKLTNSTILNNSAVNGGGLANSITGTLLLANSTIMNNSAVNGGGIVNDAQMTATNSTLSGNHVMVSGGGLASADNTANAYLNNMTIAGNQSDSNNDGLGKGGGVAVISGTVSIRNTLIGLNSDVSSQAPDCSGLLTSDRYNLIQNTTGCILSSNLVGNITGQNSLIRPLQNNGGSTWTRALLFGSPAINTGNPTTPGSGLAACLPTDQRGISRPAGGRCDIGAYEYGAVFKVFLPLVLKNF